MPRNRSVQVRFAYDGRQAVMFATVRFDPGEKKNSGNAPLRRVAQTSDIAGPLLFLVSDLSGYINGQVITVDGGVGIKFPYPMVES